MEGGGSRFQTACVGGGCPLLAECSRHKNWLEGNFETFFEVAPYKLDSCKQFIPIVETENRFFNKGDYVTEAYQILTSYRAYGGVGPGSTAYQLLYELITNTAAGLFERISRDAERRINDSCGDRKPDSGHPEQGETDRVVGGEG